MNHTDLLIRKIGEGVFEACFSKAGYGCAGWQTIVDRFALAVDVSVTRFPGQVTRPDGSRKLGSGARVRMSAKAAAYATAWWFCDEYVQLAIERDWLRAKVELPDDAMRAALEQARVDYPIDVAEAEKGPPVLDLKGFLPARPDAGEREASQEPLAAVELPGLRFPRLCRRA